MSSRAYNNLLTDCLNLKKKYLLCDWAYYKLLEQLSNEFICTPNEAVVLHAFLFAQSGYKVLIAKDKNNNLSLLVASNSLLYNKEYYQIDNENFYCLDTKSSGLYIYSKLYPQATAMSMQIDSEQYFADEILDEKMRTSNRYKEISVKIPMNKNLISFYNNYPKTEYYVYANTSLSSVVKRELYPVLKKSMQGKSEEEAANILINFVQTAFTYGYDDEIWGVDRPFFPDETIYYPYSDCEDRAILFSRLIRDLMKLDVVLLNYPNHLATAVCFNENINGDFLQIDGKKYIICDPTYINADVGESMPGFENDSIKVIMLNNIKEANSK